MYYPEQTHMVPIATITRNRLLKRPGEVVAQYGRSVAASDVVAVADYLSRRVIIDVGEELGVPAEDVAEFILVEEGQEVQPGEVLARRRRLFRSREVRAPMLALVTASEGGRLVLEGELETEELRAAVPGSVTEVLEGRGVQIQTVGTLVQGMWGTGGVNAGVMQVLGEEFGAGDTLPPSLITIDQRGMVLLTHVPIDEEVLDRLDEHRVRGMIAPCMHASLISRAREMDGVSLVLTEGFGRYTMTRAVYKLLQDHATRQVVLSAEEASGMRPEVIVPLGIPSEMPTSVEVGVPLSVEAKVRLVRAPYMGRVGTVTAIPARPQTVQNGLRTRGAWVRLGRDETVFVPLANLELLA